jgi:hypothetical protein
VRSAVVRIANVLVPASASVRAKLVWPVPVKRGPDERADLTVAAVREHDLAGEVGDKEVVGRQSVAPECFYQRRLLDQTAALSAELGRYT